ncbi:MAG: RimK/LysX family protein [Oscillatoria sp. PMC 1051.18]|nr:RimK/LysX family protein [Oscillatoria sp. PMC 1050.18]MEC5030849.1 RimK/LysX family protein [Oscillatoria sp. PMC 1051.18]
MLSPPKVKKISLVFCSLGLLLGAGCTGQPTQADSSITQSVEIVGWVEKGKISGLDQEIKFKLDTGATTSSINAEIIEQPDEETESGGMIKFRFRDGEEVSQVYELPVARWVKIESRTQDYIRRPVVRMKMCVGGSWIEEEVNLADRDDFNYSVLVGRNMLKKGKLAVDSSQTFTQDPSCPKEEEQQ